MEGALTVLAVLTVRIVVTGALSVFEDRCQCTECDRYLAAMDAPRC